MTILISLLAFATAALGLVKVWFEIREWCVRHQALKRAQANPSQPPPPPQPKPYRRMVYRNPWIDSWRR